MALSQKTLVAVGLAARLLMAAFLAVSVWLKYTNHVVKNYAHGDLFELQSYMYAAATAALGALDVVVLQLPIAVYLLCRRSKRAAPSVAALNASMYADMVASAALASGVGAGLGATRDATRIVNHGVSWERDDAKKLLDGYYARGAVAVLFLAAGLVLSMCASVVSAKLRARARNDHHLAI